MDSVNNTSKLGGDAWLELQAFKTRQINRRERLNRHKDLINGITKDFINHTASTSSNLSNQLNLSATSTDISIGNESNQNQELSHNSDSIKSSRSNELDGHRNNCNEISKFNESSSNPQGGIDVKTIECLLLLKLCDVALKLPIDSISLHKSICKVRGFECTQKSAVENLLEKFAHQELITVDVTSNIRLDNRNRALSTCNEDCIDESCIYVKSADHTKLVEFDKTFGSSDFIRSLLLESRNEDQPTDEVDSNSTSKHNHSPIQGVNSLNEPSILSPLAVPMIQLPILKFLDANLLTLWSPLQIKRVSLPQIRRSVQPKMMWKVCSRYLQPEKERVKC